MIVLITVNARRISNKHKVEQLRNTIQDYNPDVILIQEISMTAIAQLEGKKYRAIFNKAEDTLDEIGIITMVRNDYKVYDMILDTEGRIVGVKLNDLQIWNIYAQSGSNKSDREVFFNEKLPQAMISWRNHTSKTILGGDINCTGRLLDSENNQYQHYQEG